MEETQQSQGKSIAELRQIVEAESARRSLVLEAWLDLTDDQQDALIIIAQSMAAANE